jgi:nucleoside-diphosphate-sugar epimerase
MGFRQFFAIGCGYVATELARRQVARGVAAAGTTRSEDGARVLAALGISPVLWAGGDAAAPEIENGAAWLVSVPPGDAGCPAFRAFGAQAKAAGPVIYLSTTGVYGDLGGGWAFEETARQPQSREAVNRAKAEDEWLSAGATVVRLPGIYGPGRSALERVREPGARRIVKPGQVFSRAHRDDIAGALDLMLSMPGRHAVYNICDDEPAPADEVLVYASSLLGVEPPPAVAFEDAGLSPAAQRFYAECKRVSNARAKAALGWRPDYPTYREGLAACLRGGA